LQRVIRIRWATGTIATLLCLQNAWSQATPRSDEDDLASIYGDKSTISLVTGNRQPLRRAPAVATVITAQDIAAMGATDLDEVLEAVPGIHVGRSNNAYTPLYVIRGIYSELNPQTLVLQNGVPMTTLFVGNRGLFWGGQSIENIARIEIVRGPGSALYGADAFAGIINIITKNAKDIRGTEFGARTGSFNTRDAWIQHGGSFGPLDLAGNLRFGHSDGLKETVGADAQTALDQAFATQASRAPGRVNTGYDAIDGSLDIGLDKLRFRASYKLRDKLGTGAGVAAALDPVGKARSERVTADLSRNDMDIAKDWRLSLAASYLYYNQDFNQPLQLLPPGAFGGSFPNGMIGAPSTWERQIRLSAFTTYIGWANHQWRFGVGYDDLNLYKTRELKNFDLVQSGPATGLPIPNASGQVTESSVADSFMKPQRRKVAYVYAQDEWSFARDWTLTAGLRRDQFSDFGGTTNPRLALVWDARQDLTAKLLYGRAFRAPSFTEEYSINNPVIRGNPDLKPETMETFETAFAWQANAVTQVNLNLFRYNMKNIIRTIDSGGGTATFNNTGAQHGHGWEFEVTHDMRRNLRWVGHYAYQRSIDNASGQDAGYAPHHHLYLRADWGVASDWLLSGQVNHVAGRKRAHGDTRPNIADYTTVDMTLRSSQNRRGWDVALSIRNLFNADVREPSLAPGTNIPNDLPMAGRTLTAQAIYKF
jgi:outer membrane receptor protein involved in Fe transport